MKALLEKSEKLTHRVQTRFQRSLYGRIDWSNRLIGIKGSRGTGKTTLLLQRLKAIGVSPSEAAYFTLDDVFFLDHSLVETAEEFIKTGGKYLFLDEVHKYPGWARHIKNLYDFHPDLHIVFTGSSIIEIIREEADLSRRVRMYQLQGLSYREYLEYEDILTVAPFSLTQILHPDRSWRSFFPEGFMPLQHFGNYLRQGYYPFYKEDPSGYAERLNMLIRLIVEYDMAELHDFDIRNSKKLLQLLYVLSANVPFKPNLSALATKSQIHRNSINNYLNFLERAKLIHLLYPTGYSVAALQKPEKVYLDNTNLSFALATQEPDVGNLRETFFLNQIAEYHTVRYPAKGDFVVDETWTFEIGGKAKSRRQIADVEEAFVVTDEAFPVGSLPLWLFGFLY